MRKNKTIFGEIENKAKQHERHYRKNDGTAMCVISNANINYFDENEQKWKHTDNSITENEDCYEANLGNFKAQLTKEIGKSAINIFGKDMSVSWEYLGIDKPKERKAAPTIKVKKNDEKNLIVGSEAHYKNVDEGVDIQYVMVGNNVKENIIVRKKQDNYSFKFVYKLNGLELRKSEDEEKLELYSPKTNKVEFTIPAPYMYDANGAKSQDVHYEIEATTGDTYTLTVVASTEWINTKERKFPVTIDPQLNVTNQQINIGCLTEHYTAITTTGVSEFECTSVVNNMIDFTNNDTEYTIVKIDIDTSSIDIDREDVLSAYLKLYPVPNSVSIGVKCTASADNEKSEIMYLTLDSYISYIPITKLIKNSYDNISLMLTLNEKSTDTHSFYSFAYCGPEIEITYVEQERRQSNIKTFPLVGGAEAHINMLTGDKTVTVPDMIDENMGVSISHVFKYSDDDFCCGNDVRLNVHETLVKNTDDEIEASYIYTDSLGNKHYLKERFYYLVDGEKVYVEDKESVTVLPNGKLIIEASNVGEDIEIYREEASYNGQKATTKLEGVYNVEYFEQRSDEVKQLETQIESYANEMVRYSVVDDSGETIANLEENNIAAGFNALIDTDGHLLVDSDIEYVKTLNLEINSLSNSKTSIENQIKVLGLQISSIETQKDVFKSIFWLNWERLWGLYDSYLRENMNAQIDEFLYSMDKSNKNLYKQEIANYVLVDKKTGEITDTIDAENIEDKFDEYIHKAIVKNTKTIVKYILTRQEADQFRALIVQQGFLGDNEESETTQTNEGLENSNEEQYEKQDALLSVQLTDASNQYSYAQNRLEEIKAKTESNKKLLMEYYKEYLVLCENLANLKQHIPVNYITSDKSIKGFNENGDLVVIYDNHQKYIAFEYEQYSKNSVEKYRISRIYDDHENEIKLTYSKEDNVLNEIRNSNGEITTYEYDGIVLEKIVYSNDKSISISDYTNRFILNTDYFSSKIQYLDGRVSVITNSTTIDSVAHNNITTGTSKEIGKTTITYETLETLVLDDMYNGNKYIFDELGRLIEQWEISKSYVTSANKYTYDSEKENLVASISYPKESCLHQSYTGFTFDEKCLKSFTYDNYDRIETETVEMVDDTISPKVETDAKYTYNENGYVSMLRTKITTEKTNPTTIEYVVQQFEYVVQQFEYDKSGNLLCKKSYVEGEELTTGINIEEHIYDKNGFEIKTVSYNSLDPSSKIYKECEVDENGQVKSELDQSGVFKTIFDGNTAIQPNGARLSYGYSVKDGNSAITMSTEDGEENSTQTLYTNGLATKVISGDNVYEYTYDFMGRVKKIQINGDEHVNYEYSKEGLIETTTATFADGHSEIYQESSEMQSKEIRGEDVSVSQKITKVLSGGKVTSITQQENGVNVNVTEYSYYENDGRLKSERFYEYLTDGSKNEVYGQTYTYNDDGQLNYKTINSTTNPRVMNNKYKYDKNGKLLSYQCFEQGITISPKTDCLDRNRGKSISTFDGKIYSENITYLKQGDHATALPLTISYGRKIGEDFVVKENIKYKYDNMGNITKVYENGELVTEYKYDALNRLVRENNKALNKTYVFLYDNKGNIIKKKEYPFTIKCDEYLELDLPIDAVEYTYANDKLIAFGDKTITYDESGKLTNYKDKNISWSFGNRLASYGNNIFNYDAQGRRVSKNDIVYKYNTQNQIFSQSNGIKYFYDNNSSLYAFLYDENMYFYKKDLLGNVIEVLDNTGTTMVKYVYDAWGNHTIIDYTEFGLGNINPFRYRSYYYDTETGLYFLQSRYYDPQTGRFISMDDISYLDPETIGGVNLYTYCLNNPICNIDPYGNSLLVAALITAGVLIIGGGAIGGISAAMNGGASSDIWTGIGKGMLSGTLIFSGLALMVGTFFLPNTVSTEIGVFMFSLGASIFCGMFEVGITQTKKSIIDGDGFWQSTNDVINSLYANSSAVLIGKENYMGLNVYGGNAIDTIGLGVGLFNYISELNKSFKYSTAFLAGLKEFWSQKISFGALFFAGYSVYKSIRGIVEAFGSDPNESHWTLF